MMDYKNTPEGQETAAKYADILFLSRPDSANSRLLHPRMSMENRAKIFAPFAALRGYEDKIALEDWKKNRIPLSVLSDGEQEILSGQLAKLSKGQTVSVTFFLPDELDAFDLPIGTLQTMTAPVEKIDPVYQTLRLGAKVIPFELILDIADPEEAS